MSGGGGGLRSNSYATNGGAILNSASVITPATSRTTFRSINDGTRPDSVRVYGYSQTQLDLLEPSRSTFEVTLRPGEGAFETREYIFTFSTILIEEATEDDPPLFQFVEGSGLIDKNADTGMPYLIPAGLEGVIIGLYSRAPAYPPGWYIEVLNPWYSAATGGQTRRFTVTFSILSATNTRATANRVVEAVKKPLFPPSKPLRKIG